MGKHARKRQKISKDTDVPVVSKAARLEMLLDDESKDDEERRLESLLFGVEYVPPSKGKEKETMQESDDEEAGGREFQHLADQDLFFVDDAQPFAPESSDEDSDSDSDAGIRPVAKQPPKPLIKSRNKPAAWVDEADIEPGMRVPLLTGPARRRKLRQTADEDEITTREYETRLRSQFERINPEPVWARKARSGKRQPINDDGSETDEEITRLITSTNGIITKQKRRGTTLLPQGSISIERVRDANHSVQDAGSGAVRVLAFHPQPSVPVLCVATADRRVRLFNIDGHLSPLLQTLHVPSLPLISPSSALFHPQGNTLLLSGPRPFFYTYDLQQGTSTLHRRGLWGSESDFSSVVSQSSTSNRKRTKKGSATTAGGGKGGGGNAEAIMHTAFSPVTGSMLAVAGRGGNVQLVDWKSGAGQVIGTLKCSSSSGGVQGLWWLPPRSSSSGALDDEGGLGFGSGEESHLAVLTGEAEVYIWDVAQRRCVKRWKDEGGYRGAGRVFAGGGGREGWMAIGSTSGFVNVYGADSFAVPSQDTFSSGSGHPKLVKSLGHLTTPISTLRFNHDAQLLAMASKDKKDAMRLVHLPSLTSFANWPTSSTPLGYVTAVDFAARSEYMAIGNTRGRVLLYHLRDYGAADGAQTLV